jgi:hypothetical protein
LKQTGSAEKLYIVTMRAAGVLILPQMKEEEGQRKFVLPPLSLVHMHEYAQDAMTYVRNYGRPDLFITFTCNSPWPEIKEDLLDGQSSNDRHDLTARVFKQKLMKLMDVICKYHVYGETRRAG